MMKGLGVGGLVLVALLGACSGTGKTLESDSPVAAQHFDRATIKVGESGVIIPAEDRAEFAQRLTVALAAANFEPGDGLTITYRFVQFQEGAQAARWLLGGMGGVGEGSMSVEAVFSDSSGQRLGKIIAEGRIGSGAFGGTFHNVLENAAQEIARYAAAHFH